MASRRGSARVATPIEVVIDTPKGSRNKYKFDEEREVFVLHKLLPIGSAFPFDFGFVPDTEGDDGDALDVIVLGEESTFTGCRVTVRLLGIIEAEQTEKGRTIRNDRLVATPETPKIHPAERSLEDVPSRLLDQIVHFFTAYNRAEGRTFVAIARRGADAAARVIEAARRRRHASTRRESRRGAGVASDGSRSASGRRSRRGAGGRA